MKYFVIVGAGLGVVMLFLLATASANTALFERHYQLLIVFNASVVLLLMGVVGYQLNGLRQRYRAKVFGSRLAFRLVLVFSLMIVLPGALLYGVSVQFLGKSIESWFDVKVDKALESGLNLGRATLDNLLSELKKKGEAATLNLAEQPDNALPILNRLLEQSQIEEASLFSQDGKIIAFASTTGTTGTTSFLPQSLGAEVLRQARMQKTHSAIEHVPGKGLYLRVVLPVNVLRLQEDIRLLQVLQAVPRQLADEAETVQTGYRDYQELSLSRQGLNRLYGITLTLALLLALFSALAAAFLISHRISAPLGILAEATRAVAKGDFSRRLPVQSRDELGVLTRAFNSMSEQLQHAQTVARQHQAEIETARAYLESILANLSSGVMVFDRDTRLRSVNLSAEQILAAPLTPLLGLTLAECAAHVAPMRLLAAEIGAGFAAAHAGEWQRQVAQPDEAGGQVLLLRGTRLQSLAGDVEAEPEHKPESKNSTGGVVVFDDITQLLQAQRTAAWGEVARRLAHEIKNPLTPIQLSAERLRHKLSEKLAPGDADILNRATETIVNQVAALKKMVNEFSEYARAPALVLQPLDLNALIMEVLTLYESAAHIEADLAAGLPTINGDSARLRQVIHNLLQNAQDALAGASDPSIVVQTEIVEGAQGVQLGLASAVRLNISDNGSGFSDTIKMRAFEPYVTTKQKGTGLGLPVVKKIIEEHRGTIEVLNNRPHGARVSITLPLAYQRTEGGIAA